MEFKDLAPYQKAFSQFLDQEIASIESGGSLYAPIRDILTLEGKRIRPILTLISYHLFKDDFVRTLPQAMAIETFHNFTLMHDDIMDAAPTRRGQPSACVKYGLNSAILSGDAMMILAYQYLARDISGSKLAASLAMFSEISLGICEGQQLDMEFETQDIVQIEAYLTMIKKKTAILLGLAMAVGGVVAGASEDSVAALTDCGVAVGMAFQIHDDYLDAFGNPALTGKQLGGDIIHNKKTYLWLKACDLGGNRIKDELIALKNANDQVKVDRVLEIYRSLDIESYCKALQREYTIHATEALRRVEADEAAKQRIFDLIALLLSRQH
jgi:geranylgeranyl diphosphate synthase type II